jgi:hypothetical protein
MLAALAGIVLGAVRMGSRAMAPPTTAPAVGTEQDAIRAQQTLFEIVRRSTGRRPMAERVRREYILSEAELNSFLARHLGRVAGLPLDSLSIGFVGDGMIELRGRLTLDQVLGDHGSPLTEHVPKSWRSASVILTLRGPLRLETEASRGQPKALRFDVEEAYLGRQRVPVVAVERLLGAHGGLRKWSVPDSVDAVIVERGRAVVRTAS